MRRDRQKWDVRYGRGERPHDGPPSQFLRRWIPYLPRGRALDVATGLGRNALLLSRAGYRVDAVDISPVGLELAKARAPRGMRVRWIEADLDTWRPAEARYAVVVMAFYLNRKTFPRLKEAVRPGGVMVVETHLHRDDGPPPRSRYRLRPGDLRRRFAGWEILELEEGTFGDARSDVGRIVAQRPGPETHNLRPT